MAKDKKTESVLGLPFGRTNYLLMGAALLFIIIGYVSLGSGSITLAPILLVLGYCVLFPAGIIWKTGGETTEAGEDTGE
ncbi:MAG: DUF3098 domain-containing protein [FCB group bacterium]|nr:DUF3098 domain-containing protein [FCB group bacterium]